MVTDRERKILEATVREFIETGEPVSSGRLCARYDFGVKAAMIRSELEALVEQGFLEHPYRSAGRIPSDRGFEFFAEQVIRDDSRPFADDGAAVRLFEARRWDAFLEKISEQLGILGAIRSDEETYAHGIENLVANLEWGTQEEVCAVIKDFVDIGEHLEKAEYLIEETPDVFVGKRNPITRSKNLAVVGGAYATEDGPVTLLAVGPKRMDYGKVIKIFKNLKRAASNAH